MWGAVQRVQMEIEVADMRKQLGAYWEMCTSDIPANIQKRINDLTMEIQEKDSVLGDVISRQGMFV